MQMSFRWYGQNDKITLKYIKQIPGMKGIVSALYNIPVGEVWPSDKIRKLKEEVECNGLKLIVIESVPVHEEIKMGTKHRDKFIENYKQTLRNLSQNGIKTVCYNFMPVFDWTRTNLQEPLKDGSHSLSYIHKRSEQIDPISGDLELPGWDLSYQKDKLSNILNVYQTIDETKLMQNLIYFLKEIIPVAEDQGIFMAIHPDDPPWSIFGLPRVVTNKENILYLLESVNSPHNGITFCTGSLGASASNNLIDMIEIFRGRIHFVHARNILKTDQKSFQETSHSVHDGSLPMVQIMKKLMDIGFKGPIRPDHGRMIWNETGKPGYGLFDRALGATYLNGIIDSYTNQ